MKQIYRLNPGDREIFEKSNNDPSWFFDFYLKGKTSGTYWRKVTETSNISKIDEIIKRWQKGYEILLDEWYKLHNPVEFDYGGHDYKVLMENNEPTFFENHGVVILPWWEKFWNASQKTRVIIGGYGSAKTWYEMNRNLKKMATTPYYRCFVIAPFAIQAAEVLTQAKRLINGTEYQKRFMPDGGFRTKPNPSITVKNDVCMESTMEFFSIEKNYDKLLNMSGDSFHVEQAEQLDDIDGLMEIISSRLRGQVAGRELEGIITFIANSTENGSPQLWDYYHEAESDPDSVISGSPKIWENPYITVSQLIEITKRIARGSSDPNIIERALEGAEPIGSGEHFSRDNLQKCRSTLMDDQMNKALNTPDSGAIRVVQPKAQVVEWSLPPEKDHLYLEVADPGWSNPPLRNSACVMVFDITEYPHVPAFIRAFSWVYGNHSPDPWIQKYIDYCMTYNCRYRNGFDSTGQQSGYGRNVHGLQNLYPWEFNLAGGNKYAYLNATKTMVSRGLYQFPDIPMLFSQLAKYKLPDEKIRQDLVATLILASGFIDYLFSTSDDSPANVVKDDEGRYKFHERSDGHRR